MPKILNIIISLLVGVFILGSFSISLAREDGINEDFPKTTYEKVLQNILLSKNPDFTKEKRDELQKKFNIPLTGPRGEIANDFYIDNWEWRNLDSILETEQNGGFNLLSGLIDSDLTQTISLVTGNTSMNDAMNLGNFSSGRKNEKKLLENINKALEAYKRNSDKKKYPNSLQDFKKYEDEWWAGIEMAGDDGFNRKNISEISDLFEYKVFIKNNNEIIKIENISFDDDKTILKSPIEKIAIYNNQNVKDFTLVAKNQLDILVERINKENENKQPFSELSYDIKYPMVILTYIKNGKKYEGDFEILEYPDCHKRLFDKKKGESLECLQYPWEKSTVSLSLKKNKNKEFNISEISPVESKSHNFDELLKNLASTSLGNPLERIESIPEIYNYIPADTFSIYFSSTEKYKQLSQTMANPLSELSQISPIPNVKTMEKMIGKRLGIGDPTNFLGMVEEFAFVGDDIRLFPSSDFAIIFKCKSDIPCEFTKAKKIGDYFILSTDEKFLDKSQFTQPCECPQGIKCNCIRSLTSLKNQKDFQYAWAVTDEKKDGFIFFSDSFIRKMVSPEYRINLRRQKSVIEAMNILQYISWVYKDIEGVFPKNINELIENKYLGENILFQKEKYYIDTSGIIHHTQWGTPFSITPVLSVEISQISSQEKQWYETGRDMYESNYREFMDPVGIQISIDEKIKFHTIILPLSGSQEYQMLKNLVGEGKEKFDLYERNKNIAGGIWLTFNAEKISETLFGIPFADLEKEIKKYLIDLEIESDVIDELFFDFIGDEIMYGVEDEIYFNFNTLSAEKVSVFASLKITNKEKAEKIFKLFFNNIKKEFSGGFFNIEVGDYEEKIYNNVKYFSFPIEFINIYIAFEDDAVSVSTSEQTIKNIIDRKYKNIDDNNKKNIPEKRNIIVTGDMEKVSKWVDFIPLYLIKKGEKEIINEMLGIHRWRNNNHSYEAEYSLIKDVLGNEFMNTNISQYPNRLGYKIEFENKIPEWKNFKTHENIDISEIYKKLDLFSSVKNFLQAYGKIGLTFAFTDHGAEIKIEFDNSSFEKKYINMNDENRNEIQPNLKPEKSINENLAQEIKKPQLYSYLLWGAGILFFIILISIIIFIILKKKKNDESLENDDDENEYIEDYLK